MHKLKLAITVGPYSRHAALTRYASGGLLQGRRYMRLLI